MTDDPFGREERPGLLARLFARRSAGPSVHVPRTVTKTENLSFVVPEARAVAVQPAIERWLAGREISASVTREPQPEGKVRLAVRITGSDAAKLDLQDPAVQA